MNVMLTVLCLSLGVHGVRYVPCTTSTEVAMSLEELERSVYNVARIKEVSPTVIIYRLLRKAKARQHLNPIPNRNPLQQIALTELLRSVPRLPPPLPKNGAREHLPMPSRKKPTIGKGFPASRFGPPPNQRTPSGPYPIASGGPYSVGQFPGTPPIFIPDVKTSVFQPPPGVVIRVNPGDPAKMLPDVIVTFSPMMTVMEALRQAEEQFRSSLGILNTTQYIISIKYNRLVSCSVISRFGNLSATDNHAWDIAVVNYKGEEIYESICVPTGNEVPVTSGTTISLIYT